MCRQGPVPCPSLQRQITTALEDTGHRVTCIMHNYRARNSYHAAPQSLCKSARNNDRLTTAGPTRAQHQRVTQPHILRTLRPLASMLERCLHQCRPVRVLGGAKEHAALFADAACEMQDRGQKQSPSTCIIVHGPCILWVPPVIAQLCVSQPAMHASYVV